MGIGSLRRYHKPVEQAPVAVEPGVTSEPDEAAKAAEANAAKIAAEQAAQVAAANGDQDGAQSVNPVIQAAGGHEDNESEPEPATVPVAHESHEPQPGDVDVPTASDLGGDVEPWEAEASAQAAQSRLELAKAAGLNRGSGTEAWRKFATEQGVDGAADKSRDDLADLFIPKA